MWRRLRWILLAIVVALAAAVITAVIVEKPALDDDEQAVDVAWKPLRDSLDARYATLDAAVTQLNALGESDRSVTKALVADLAAWRKAVDSGSATDQADAANDLEGTGLRLRANVLGSPRLNQDGTLTGTIAAFDTATPPVEQVKAYNNAVRTYEDDRTDTLRRVVALMFGFGARPLFSVPA